MKTIFVRSENNTEKIKKIKKNIFVKLWDITQGKLPGRLILPFWSCCVNLVQFYQVLAILCQFLWCRLYWRKSAIFSHVDKSAVDFFLGMQYTPFLRDGAQHDIAIKARAFIHSQFSHSSKKTGGGESVPPGGIGFYLKVFLFCITHVLKN